MNILRQKLIKLYWQRLCWIAQKFILTNKTIITFTVMRLQWKSIVQNTALEYMFKYTVQQEKPDLNMICSRICERKTFIHLEQ